MSSYEGMPHTVLEAMNHGLIVIASKFGGNSRGSFFLTKNSSLAAAIAYPDLVLVFAGTALMQTGKAIEIVSITMLTYLTISLSIAALMNWYNKKIEIKEK